MYARDVDRAPHPVTFEAVRATQYERDYLVQIGLPKQHKA